MAVAKRNYDSIDVMKLVLAVMVVAIHCNPLENAPAWLNCSALALNRLAVPLFFITSAWFLFLGGPLTRHRAVRYLKRLGALYAAWFVVSLPVTVWYRFIMSDLPLQENISIFVRKLFFSSSFQGSWFLASCMFCVAFFHWVYSSFPRASRTITVISAVVIYLMGVFSTGWANVIYSLGLGNGFERFCYWFASPGTCILTGIPYFAVGKWLAAREVKTPPAALTLLALAAVLAEVNLTHHYGLTRLETDCYFSLLPCAALLFATILNINVNVAHAATMRQTSTLVFFSQFIGIFVVKIVQWALHITIAQPYYFVAVLAFCFMVSRAVLAVTKRHPQSPLRHLY